MVNRPALILTLDKEREDYPAAKNQRGFAVSRNNQGPSAPMSFMAKCLMPIMGIWASNLTGISYSISIITPLLESLPSSSRSPGYCLSTFL